MNTIRAFIAFELPEAVLNSIQELQKQLKKRGFKLRWVRPEAIHLTLKFLGDISKDQVDLIGNVIKDTAEGYAPLSLFARSIGVFPGLRRPRVIWIGIDGAIDILKQLQKALDKNLQTIGFEPEKRSYKGHLTIGRIKKTLDSEKLVIALREYYEFQTEPFTMDRVSLFQSELKPTGAVYTSLKEIKLSTNF